MEPQTQTVANSIPKLGDVPAIPVVAFAAFKEESRISFVRGYDPKVSAIAGYRHAIIRYRNTAAKGTVERAAQMVTVPQLVLGADYQLPANAAVVFRGVLEDEEDSIIRSLLDQGASTVSWDSVGVAAALASITAVRTSNRLSKEQIEAWGTKALADVCLARANEIIADKKLAEPEALKQRAGTLNAYVALAAKMAAPVPNIGMDGARALKAMMERGSLADDVAKVILAKIEAILNPKILESGDL